LDLAAGLAALTGLVAGLAATFFAGLAGALGAGFFFAGMTRGEAGWQDQNPLLGRKRRG
jgi:hypothetical protein